MTLDDPDHKLIELLETLKPGSPGSRLVIPPLKIRLCSKCYEAASKTPGLLEKVLRLAGRGSWICPWQKEDCGKTIPTKGTER